MPAFFRPTQCADTALLPTLKAEGVSRTRAGPRLSYDPLVYQVDTARAVREPFALRDVTKAVPNGLTRPCPFICRHRPGDGLDDYGRVLHGPARREQHAANRESRLWVPYCSPRCLARRAARRRARSGFRVPPRRHRRVSGQPCSQAIGSPGRWTNSQDTVCAPLPRRPMRSRSTSIPFFSSPSAQGSMSFRLSQRRVPPQRRTVKPM